MFWQMLYFGKVVVFEQIWLYSCKVVVFGQTGCICRMSFLSGNWLYSGKFGCIWAKVVVLEQKLLYSGKVVLFWQK